MICGLILNVSWNANLISYLSTHKISMPFESLEKLLQATNFKIAIIPESAQEDNFKLSSDPIKRKIYNQRIKPYLYDFDSYSGKCIWIATFINIPIYRNTKCIAIKNASIKPTIFNFNIYHCEYLVKDVVLSSDWIHQHLQA